MAHTLYAGPLPSVAMCPLDMKPDATATPPEARGGVRAQAQAQWVLQTLAQHQRGRAAPHSRPGWTRKSGLRASLQAQPAMCSLLPHVYVSSDTTKEGDGSWSSICIVLCKAPTICCSKRRGAMQGARQGIEACGDHLRLLEEVVQLRGVPAAHAPLRRRPWRQPQLCILRSTCALCCMLGLCT